LYKLLIRKFKCYALDRQTDIILSGNSHYYFIQYIKPDGRQRSACRYNALPPIAVQLFVQSMEVNNQSLAAIFKEGA
jgi:hypothetical protein